MSYIHTMISRAQIKILNLKSTMCF
uniref:Uncharacterized protein n=1 Tax=Arundo donax TaxID=35708 RepID=A0A0A8YNZ1_ARUDO